MLVVVVVVVVVVFVVVIVIVVVVVVAVVIVVHNTMKTDNTVVVFFNITLFNLYKFRFLWNKSIYHVISLSPIIFIWSGRKFLVTNKNIFRGSTESIIKFQNLSNLLTI